MNEPAQPITPNHPQVKEMARRFSRRVQQMEHPKVWGCDWVTAFDRGHRPKVIRKTVEERVIESANLKSGWIVVRRR